MNKWILILVASLIFAAAANAAVQPCEREVSLFGTYAHTAVDGLGSSDGLGIGAGISQFISDEFSVGLQTYYDWGNDGDIYNLGLNGKYHLSPTANVVPYLGGQLNYTYLKDNSSDGGMWGPLAGVRFCLADRTSMFVEYQYQMYIGGVKSTIEKANAVFVGFIWGY